jgi:acetyl esterase/lipase
MQMEDTGSIMSFSINADSEHRKIRLERPPYHLRVAYFISVWSFKAAISIGLRARRLFSRRSPNLVRPQVKSYPVRPSLKNRIFRPEGSRSESLPLYLDVHGGGWAVADPEVDDEFCSFIAQKFNIIVVSVDYRKAPIWKFPYAVGDITAIADAVIRDESLHIDSRKVSIGGFSAGGNLAFAASQMEILEGRIAGLIGFYPCLDLTESLEEKLKRRPKGVGTDLLESSANFLDWAYVPYGVDRRDPLLSPKWAKREDLPQYVYLVGAEYDMLCYEANQMAESLAEPEFERKHIQGLPAKDGWEQGGIRWECARGKQHAFAEVQMQGQKEIERLKTVNEMYSRVGEWLNKKVWANELGD